MTLVRDAIYTYSRRKQEVRNGRTKTHLFRTPRTNVADRPRETACGVWVPYGLDSYYRPEFNLIIGDPHEVMDPRAGHVDNPCGNCRRALEAGSLGANLRIVK